MNNAEIVTGNYYDKYKSQSPLIKFVMNKYFSVLDSFLAKSDLNSVLDLGCGEGEIVRHITKHYKPGHIKGYDIDTKLIEKLKKEYPDYSFETKFLDKDFSESGDFTLAICLEVLEHIENYKGALENIKKINVDRIIFSVPNEPLFRMANLARLKYVKRLGNTPGHVNNFTPGQFKKLIKSYFPDRKIIFENSIIWNFAYIY